MLVTKMNVEEQCQILISPRKAEAPSILVEIDLENISVSIA